MLWRILLVVNFCASSCPLLAQASRVIPGLKLSWPVAPDPNTTPGVVLDLGQTFSELSAVVLNKYHSGIDISGVAAGTPVFAAGPGMISKIQLLDTSSTCLQTKSCEDHGMGNTVIVKHVVGNVTVYTQYSHMSSIPSFWVQVCGPVDKGKKFRHTCTNSALVDPASAIGTVGGSGYGKQNYWPIHLHFELKDLNYLGDVGDDGTGVNWGYSTVPPDTDHYHDPVLNLASSFDLNQPLTIMPNSNIALRVGPGGLDGFGAQGLTGDSGYFRAPTTLSQGTTYSAIRYSPATTARACQTGWYEIAGSFPDPGLGSAATLSTG